MRGGGRFSSARLIAALTRSAIAAAALAAANCAPGPLSGHPVSGPANSPIPVSSKSSSNAVEFERRRLLGTWDLVSLEMTSSEEAAQRVAVEATGILTYDEYGNLTIDAHTTDPAAPIAAREKSRLSFKGRAVIDTAKGELKLMNVTGNVNPDEVLSPDYRRRYVFGDNTLTLSTFDDQGRVTAVATWRHRD